MPTNTIHVTVPHAFGRVMPAWVDVHRTAWHDADTERRDGFLIASPMRTLFGLAAAFNQHRFERAAEDAWHLGLVTPATAAQYLQQHRCRGKDGVSRIERWLERAGGQARPAQSNLERDLIHHLEVIGVRRPVQSSRPTHRQPQKNAWIVSLSAHLCAFCGMSGSQYPCEGLARGGGSLGCCCNDLGAHRVAPSRFLMEADHHV